MPEIVLTVMPAQNPAMRSSRRELLVWFKTNLRQKLVDAVNQFYGDFAATALIIDATGLRVVEGNELDENYPPFEVGVVCSVDPGDKALTDIGELIYLYARGLRILLQENESWESDPELRDLEVKFVINGMVSGCSFSVSSGEVRAHWPEVLPGLPLFIV